MFDTFRGIDSEHFNRCAPIGGLALQHGSSPLKMFVPRLSSGVEQRRKFVRGGIVARDIWAFGSVAVRAGEAQVSRLALALMLEGANVIDFVGQGRVGLM
jgi:hypothetical protein